jgi:hypothetical protein
MFFSKVLKGGSTEDAQYGIAHSDRRHRTWQPINDCKLADDGAWAVKCQNALGAGFRNHRKFEQSIVDAIAAVAGIAGPEQHLTGRKPHHVGAGE